MVVARTAEAVVLAVAIVAALYRPGRRRGRWCTVPLAALILAEVAVAVTATLSGPRVEVPADSTLAGVTLAATLTVLWLTGGRLARWADGPSRLARIIRELGDGHDPLAQLMTQLDETSDCEPTLTFWTDQWTLAVIDCEHGSVFGDESSKVSFLEATRAAAAQWHASHQEHTAGPDSLASARGAR
jgi:hypothetical protein